jgi:hypothetical protein
MCLTPRFARLHSTALLLATITGCGSGLSPVEGKIVWSDGSPAKELSGGQVVLENTEARTSSIGVIEVDGSFHMTTLKPNDGVPKGNYKIAILEHRPNANEGGTQLVPAKLDLKYANLESSGLEAKITPGKNQITLTLDRAK